MNLTQNSKNRLTAKSDMQAAQKASVFQQKQIISNNDNAISNVQ